ncbi:MAG: hypothetical protein HY263_03815 [Chloroflexi bacterium]|nr:hypothetical protein [Chloroflexota bacterium]
MLVDPSTVTGQRLGVGDKPGQASPTPWLDPGIGIEDAISVAPGGSMSIGLSDGSSCLGSWHANALPYYADAVPSGFAPVALGGREDSTFATTGLITVPARGDWIVRVDAVVGGAAPQAWYFRVRVGLPEPSPLASPITPATPCQTERLDAPPDFVLEGPDSTPHRAIPYGVTWDGKPFGDGLWLAGPTIDVASGSELRIQVVGDVCAIEWTVLYGPVPTGPGAQGFHPEGDLVPPLANRDPSFASQNRFALAALPPGTWLIGGSFGFVHGEAQVTWQVTVK